MALDLTLLEPGFSLGRAGSCLEVRKDGKVVESVPIHRLNSVTLGPGLSISSDAMAALADRGAILQVQDGADRPAAVMFSPHGWGGANLRRHQAMSSALGRALPLAQALVRAKILHQGRLQQLWARYATQEARRQELEEIGGAILALAPGVEEHSSPGELMALEGQASRLHWSGLALMVPFRERRYPKAPDLTNQLLNYGYGILTRHWLNTVLRAGLDPHIGFLHADRVGRPSLVFDLLEPWRPWVDRAIVGLIRQGSNLGSQQGELGLDTRRRVLETLHRAFQSVPNRHRQPLRTLWLVNTRQLARHLCQGDPWQPLSLHP